MTTPESDASLASANRIKSKLMEAQTIGQLALVLIHATKDPNTWVLGQRSLRPEEQASLKLRPERWEMFLVERLVVSFDGYGVNIRVDRNDVTNFLRDQVVPRAICALSQETTAEIVIYADRAIRV